MSRQQDGQDLKLKEVVQEISSVMLKHIDQLKTQVDNIKYPQGTRENPAISCREIALGHPNFKTGWYWVDPTQGSIKDALQVWCNMTDIIETCVYPTPKTKMISEKQWTKPEGRDRWFAQLNGGFKIDYTSSVQLKLLRLASEGVSQRFTYYCSGSVAWYDQSTGNHDNALILRGHDKYEFDTSKFSMQQIIHDGCRDRRQNGFTVFEIKTRKLDRLPITNFKPVDFGNPWQKFGFEAGPVCFH